MVVLGQEVAVKVVAAVEWWIVEGRVFGEVIG